MSEKYYVYPGIFGVSAEKVEAELKEFSLRPGLDISVEGDRMSAYITVEATAETLEKAKEICKEITDFLREKYGDAMFTESEGNLWRTVVSDYCEKKMTFALAESCTGGLISKMITDVPGASQVFSLGVVSYSPEAKMKTLRVNEETIEKQGVVSDRTAREMAEGVRLTASSDIGIGVTGFAGPGDGDERYGRGTVFIALSDGKHTYVRQLKMPKLDRSGIRRAATLHALYMLHAVATGKMESIGVVGGIPKLAKAKKKLPLHKRILHFFTDFPKDPVKEKLRKAVFLTALIVMTYAGFRFGQGMYYEYRHNVVRNEINDLVQKGEDLTDDERQDIIDDLKNNGVDVDENISNWALLLYQKNPDLVGRVRIEADGKYLIDEIIVQGENNDEYLRRDFYHHDNSMGCSFMDSKNSKDATDPNTILYGHSTESGEKIMTGLHRYKKLSYLNKNPLIKYETLTDESYYKIFAVIILDASPKHEEEIFNDCYYRGTTVYKKLESIRDHSMYDTTVDVNETDKLLTISTCTFEMDDLRLVIMARKVREGESLEVEPASINPDAIFFDGWDDRHNVNDPVSSTPSTPENSSEEDVSSDITSSESTSIPDEDKRFELFDMSFFCATATADEPSSVRISAAYISDFDSDCTIGIVTYPNDGNVKIVSSSNSITYTPDNGYSGMDSFEISLSDRTGLNYDTAKVYVYVGMEQQSGVSVPYDILYLSAKAGKSATEQINAKSAAGEKLTYEILKTEGLYSGTAEVDEKGKVTYTSIRDKRYQDVFKVLVTDESGYARMVEVRVNTTYDFEYETEI